MGRDDGRPLMQLRLSDRRILLALGDLVAVNLSVLIALFVWTVVAGYRFGPAFIVPRSYWFPLLTALWLFLAAANDFYSLRLAANASQSFVRLVEITLQLLVVYLIIFFLSPREALPRLFILYYGGASFVLLAIWRLWQAGVMRWAGFRRRALIVGTGWGAEAIIRVLRDEAPGDYEIVGLIGEGGGEVEGVPVIGTGAELAEIATREDIAEVIIATSRALPGDVFKGVMDCYERGIAITPMPLLYEEITGRVPVEHVGQHWAVVLPLERGSIFDPYPLLKRTIDIAAALIGLAMFGIMLPILALGIVIDSPGPVFYVQERLGKAGKPFELIKLRTMVPDAERMTGPKWASRDDPRITRVGRFLRKTRLDELPQLLNVLRGEMSLVGPRPERPEFVEVLEREIPFYRARLAVKPGLTGWAQVQYRYGSTKEDALVKLQYDLYYIRHRSLTLDALILLRTVYKVLLMQGT